MGKELCDWDLDGYDSAGQRQLEPNVFPSKPIASLDASKITIGMHQHNPSSYGATGTFGVEGPNCNRVPALGIFRVNEKLFRCRQDHEEVGDTIIDNHCSLFQQ